MYSRIISAHKKHLSVLTTLIHTGSGMHVVLLIKPKSDGSSLADLDIANEVKKRQIQVNPLKLNMGEAFYSISKLTSTCL